MTTSLLTEYFNTFHEETELTLSLDARDNVVRKYVSNSSTLVITKCPILGVDQWDWVSAPGIDPNRIREVLEKRNDS